MPGTGAAGALRVLQGVWRGYSCRGCGGGSRTGSVRGTPAVGALVPPSCPSLSRLAHPRPKSLRLADGVPCLTLVSPACCPPPAAGMSTEAFSDYVVGHGELWSAHLMALYCQQQGADCA